ncbi:hypothetical protein HN51_050827 [Arachis hypogaea]|uniref:probable protein phosphatase 2C 6 n=1 Tax=Arachis ipaensis TaxID=130454 RepID=UPI000A2B2379|nr:probable protein phosphatase 2C 6 [Arachis ipaensis]
MLLIHSLISSYFIEWAKIEAARGRVIYWQGYRVLSILAMSRSIDMYLPLASLQHIYVNVVGFEVMLVTVNFFLIRVMVSSDRYLKPCIIPEPEVKFVQWEKHDECLFLASNGLWDVVTNDEAREVARKRILLWHKKYGETASMTEQVEEAVDPAAHAATEYLSRLALQRGSKDNIFVIVIDLKA